MASRSKRSTPITYDKTWQFNKSVTECNRHMLEHGIATDIDFLVSYISDQQNDNEDTQTFSAHKYMLISRSPVFYSMLCGDLAERGEIKVTDVHPEAFRAMLNYIYTDEDPKLSLNMVAPVIYTSKKYQLPGLRTKCAEFITDHLNPSTVCMILDQLIHCDESALTDMCLNLIMRETKKVLGSEAFLSLSRNALSKILNIKTCEVKEVDMFTACLKWARKRCVEQKKEATGTNMRGALGECFTLFRFSDVGDFARDICSNGVFTKDEEYAMLCHLADKRAIPAPAGFSCEARQRPIYKVLTTNEIQKHVLKNFGFKIRILNYTQTDINVISLFIGNMDCFWIMRSPAWAGVPNDKASIKYIDSNIRVGFCDAKVGKMLELPIRSQLIIKPGSSPLELTYYRYPGSTATEDNMYGVSQREIYLNDGGRIVLKISATNYNNFIPLLGLTYQIHV